MKKYLNEHTTLLEIKNKTNHEIPVIISIPHSGVYILPEMKHKLTSGIILPNSDWYLPKLYSFLESLGYTVIINNVNRYVIDVNRQIDEKLGDSYKTNVIYTHTTQDDKIYHTPLTQQEIKKRVMNYYLPYHQALKKSIEDKLKVFKKVYVIDLHSFGLNYGADVIIGNNFNKSCSNNLTNFFQTTFLKSGFTVKENNPYSGGYITKHYEKKETTCEAIQLELWYCAYIQNKIFGKEEFPMIDKNTFNHTQIKLEEIFKNFKEWLQHQIQ